jgi:hypothetical protein
LRIGSPLQLDQLDPMGNLQFSTALGLAALTFF